MRSLPWAAVFGPLGKALEQMPCRTERTGAGRVICFPLEVRWGGSLGRDVEQGWIQDAAGLVGLLAFGAKLAIQIVPPTQGFSVDPPARKHADGAAVHEARDALVVGFVACVLRALDNGCRSEEHTSELQSQFHLVCRLLLEKK